MNSENPLNLKNLLSGVIVTIIGGIILAFVLRDARFSPQQITVETPLVPHVTSQLPTKTQNPDPVFSNFLACLGPCDGSNATRSFPRRTDEIYLQWDYANVPKEGHYIRTWIMDGREWVRYDCIWPGPPKGQDKVVLRAPKGLHAGTWEITIRVDNVILLQEELTVEGNNKVWEPKGTIHRCYNQ
jgi:hypothetical protein